MNWKGVKDFEKRLALASSTWNKSAEAAEPCLQYCATIQDEDSRRKNTTSWQSQDRKRKSSANCARAKRKPYSQSCRKIEQLAARQAALLAGSCNKPNLRDGKDVAIYYDSSVSNKKDENGKELENDGLSHYTGDSTTITTP